MYLRGSIRQARLVTVQWECAHESQILRNRLVYNAARRIRMSLDMRRTWVVMSEDGVSMESVDVDVSLNGRVIQKLPHNRGMLRRVVRKVGCLRLSGPGRDEETYCRTSFGCAVRDSDTEAVSTLQLEEHEHEKL